MMKHYAARSFGCDDPSALWGMELGGTDAPFLMGLILSVAGSGMMVRWMLLVPVALFSVLGYAAAAYLIGSPDMRLARLNLTAFALIVLVTCCGKWSCELQARLFHLSHLREKRMPFQAELPSERLQADCGGGARRGQCSPRSAPSAPPSAPAPLGPAAAGGAAEGARPCPREASGEAAPECSDCLPLDARVWVEGCAGPRALRDIEPGQRVLCHDALGRSNRYARVLEKQVAFGDAPWVRVGLADGTQLAMTADHPVKPANGEEVVRAADLAAGRDRVVVHRVMTGPVAVTEVSPQPGAQCPRGRAYLVVQQPDRHMVLVAPAGAEAEVSSLAVCSADVAVVRSRRHRVSTSGTFLHVHLAPQGEARRPARPRSEPPRRGP
ncbi:unnamed protein product, partial [Prorocentrum cordatum]